MCQEQPWSLNPSSPARIATLRHLKSCQLMPASFSILAPAAARRCGRSRVIVASSAPTARSRARRSRPSVRPAPLPAVVDSVMANDIVRSSRDWLRSPHTGLLAWWIPQAAILAGLFAPVPVRTAIWIIALIWMGTACILNAKRCGRTHCRFTGPYYLAMIIPVLALVWRSFREACMRGLCSASSLFLATSSSGGRPSGRGENSQR